MKITILIPCYNEEKTIEELVSRVLNSPIPHEKEIIIVDDGSTDNTKTILENKIKPLVSKIIYHSYNQGKGAALATGLSMATGDILIIQDADLEYDPQDYSCLIQPIENKATDVVYGSRLLNDNIRKTLFRMHYIGTKCLTFISNLFTGQKLTDMETCYKAFSKNIYSQLTIQEKSFGVEPEITAKIAKLNARIEEVSINYNGRTYEEGKKITWKDGFRAIYCIIKYNLLNH
jgi:glycosyltransferase involved in cell wall biosynthesis